MKTIVIAVSVVGVLGFGAYMSAHGGNTALVHGCVDNKTGAVRVVAATGTCIDKESALDWSIVGPIGPQGVQGIPGAQGVPGDSRILTVGTKGANSLNTLIVPYLGVIEVACTDASAATMTLTPAGPMRLVYKPSQSSAEYEQTMYPDIQPVGFTRAASLGGFSTVDKLIVMMGDATWTIDYTLAGARLGSDFGVAFSCMVNVVVTVH